MTNMLDASARQHTASCLREREYHDIIKIITYDRSDDAPRCQVCNGTSPHPTDALNEYCGHCLGTGRDLFAVKLWCWKTKPLFFCYFLLHRWEVVTQGNVHNTTLPIQFKYGARKYIVEVCRCGADRLTLHHSLPNEHYDMFTGLTEKWDEVWTTTKVTNRTAAWNSPGTHSGGPR